jgi:hypothetical protein
MFEINGIDWEIEWCLPTDDNLRRSDGSLTVGMTDNRTKTIYLSDRLSGDFLRKVTAHELVHCFCFSYNVLMDIEQEEFMADWISRYGEELVYLLDDIMRGILRKAYIA